MARERGCGEEARRALANKLRMPSFVFSPLHGPRAWPPQGARRPDEAQSE
jgi:hypothetical protein